MDRASRVIGRLAKRAFTPMIPLERSLKEIVQIGLSRIGLMLLLAALVFLPLLMLALGFLLASGCSGESRDVVIYTGADIILRSKTSGAPGGTIINYYVRGMPADRFARAMRFAGYEVVSPPGSDEVSIKGEKEPFSSVEVGAGAVHFYDRYGKGEFVRTPQLYKIAESLTWGE